MLIPFFKFIFGTKNQRDLKKLKPRVEKINQKEEFFSSLSDSQLQERSIKLRDNVRDSLKKDFENYEEIKDKFYQDVDRVKKAKEHFDKIHNDFLDSILEEAFALVRESSKRILKMRHYDVQLMGGIVLNQNKIAEMATGEGKTLVATLPAYLNALSGFGVHIITVNDYLAKRDHNWMGPLYNFLGLSVGLILHDMPTQKRKEAYNKDITFGTNNEFGFDFLRDNMGVSVEEQVQRERNFCIIDEVDSILIDEARTPLIISGSVDTVSHCYDEVKSTVDRLVMKQDQIVKSYYKDLDEAIASKAKNLKECLYTIYRGAPKDPDFLSRIAQHSYLKRELESAITHFGSKERAKERVALDEKLFYVYDEKTREVLLNAKGEEVFAKDFKEPFRMEDIRETITHIHENETLSVDDKDKMEKEAYATYEKKIKRIRSFEQLLKAFILFHVDVDYVVQDKKVVIVDEFTGRMMPGRRFSQGLHEALEAKENVKIQRESQTLATITFQNYFRLYQKLSGMTGTADTEATEFHEIYNLDVVVIPTNKTLQRRNHPDVIYKTAKEKMKAVVDEIESVHREGRPVLVGTISVERSEYIAHFLKKRNIVHEVLNAKNHAREAEIIAMAGQSGVVTIATNMAGRGTDIILGDGVMERGGLHVIGTERHESRRIDNQLRGRSGRQGDPGSSRFFLSFEDDLMRIFGSDRIARLMERFHMKDGEDIQSPLVSKAIETSQKRVESHNFDIRKWLIKYDNVINKQREMIYEYRQRILEQKNLLDHVTKTAKEFVEETVDQYLLEQENEMTDFDGKGFSDILLKDFHCILSDEDLEKAHNENNLKDFVWNSLHENFSKKMESFNEEEKSLYLSYHLLECLDRHWKDNLYVMDDLRESVGLRAYGQIDPLHEYKKEGHRQFLEMFDNMTRDAVHAIFATPRANLDDLDVSDLEQKSSTVLGRDILEMLNIKNTEDNESPEEMIEDNPLMSAKSPKTYVRSHKKIGRNELCFCGSGKKYKKCCGR